VSNLSGVWKPILKKTAVLNKPSTRGAIWTVLGFGTGQVLRFVGNLILTRLLVPEYFGIMAVVNSLVLGVALFSDIGIQQNIVQSKDGEKPEFLNTAWTLQIIRGAVIFLIISVLAWPIALYYEEPILTPVIILVGFGNMIFGFTSTKLWLLNRHLKLGWFSALDLASHFLGLLVMVIWALISPTIWALPVGILVSNVFRVLISHFVLPGPNNKIAWDKNYKSEIFSFGRWVMLATATMFLSEQADRFILAKLLSFSLVGVYTIAFSLAILPKQVIKKLNHLVIFPVVSQNADLPRQALRNKILHKRKTILTIFALGLALSLTFGDLLISFLYDERYADAAWMFSLLCLGVWFSVLFYTSVPCLMGIGKPVYNAQGNFARLVVVIGGIPLGYSLAGPFGAVVAIAIGDFPAYLAIQFGLFREKLSFYRQDLWSTGLFVAISLILLAGRYLSGWGTPFDVLLGIGA
jgi:O-antigen/teichoic acid export membrane protein